MQFRHTEQFPIYKSAVLFLLWYTCAIYRVVNAQYNPIQTIKTHLKKSPSITQYNADGAYCNDLSKDFIVEPTRAGTGDYSKRQR